MRRTSICLAIVALFWSVKAWGQEPLPVGPPTTLLDRAEAAGWPTTPHNQQQSLVPQPDPMAGASENVWNQPQGQPQIQPVPTGGEIDEASGLGPCCQQTGEGYCCPKDWYFDQRLRLMYHPEARGIVMGQIGALAQIYNGITFETRFVRGGSAAAWGPRFEPAAGYEATIGHYLGRDSANRDRFLEFTYYGLQAWQNRLVTATDETIEATSTSLWPNADQLGANQILASGDFFSAFSANIAGFSRADRQEVEYKSRFDNFELNLRLQPRMRRDRLILEPNGQWRREAQESCRASWLGGIRCVSLDESYHFLSSGHQVLTDGGALVREYDVTGRYDIRTRNDLLGLQIGGEITKRYGLVTCGMRGKVGGFINFADQIGRIQTTGADLDPLATVDDFDVEGTTHSHQAAAVAEFGLLGSYRIRKNVIAHVAYDLMWIGGLALAPDQIQPSTIAPETIYNRGILLFQSASLGLEITW